jgi:hypothetical protein
MRIKDLCALHNYWNRRWICTRAQNWSSVEYFHTVYLGDTIKYIDKINNKHFRPLKKSREMIKYEQKINS